MKSPSNIEALRLLAAQLKACPAQDNTFSEALALLTWERFKEEMSGRRDPISPAVMAGLVLFDDNFARLLNETERSQLAALAKLALERFEAKAHPPNKLGKILAASLKEST